MKTIKLAVFAVMLAVIGLVNTGCYNAGWHNQASWHNDMVNAARGREVEMAPVDGQATNSVTTTQQPVVVVNGTAYHEKHSSFELNPITPVLHGIGALLGGLFNGGYVGEEVEVAPYGTSVQVQPRTVFVQPRVIYTQPYSYAPGWYGGGGRVGVGTTFGAYGPQGGRYHYGGSGGSHQGGGGHH